MTVANPYETREMLSEYLLFHYGAAGEILPGGQGPVDALDFPVRCAQLALAHCPEPGRALDLGCAVGRSAFELARACPEVVAIDYSAQFVEAAAQLQKRGELPYQYRVEGDLFLPAVARLDPLIPRGRVHFRRGDACNLPGDLGCFDLVLMANLIDRLADPSACLNRLPTLVAKGGLLLITSPYTWLVAYTPREKWLSQEGRTFDRLKSLLAPAFQLITAHDLPFLIREHARKFQWSLAHATLWRRQDRDG